MILAIRFLADQLTERPRRDSSLENNAQGVLLCELAEIATPPTPTATNLKTELKKEPSGEGALP